MRRDERGQTTLLIIGFAIVAIMMVAVVVPEVQEEAAVIQGRAPIKTS